MMQGQKYCSNEYDIGDHFHTKSRRI